MNTERHCAAHHTSCLDGHASHTLPCGDPMPCFPDGGRVLMGPTAEGGIRPLSRQAGQQQPFSSGGLWTPGAGSLSAGDTEQRPPGGRSHRLQRRRPAVGLGGRGHLADVAPATFFLAQLKRLLAGDTKNPGQNLSTFQSTFQNAEGAKVTGKLFRQQLQPDKQISSCPSPPAPPPGAALGQGRYQPCQINITKGPFTLAESLVTGTIQEGGRSCGLGADASAPLV